MRRAALPLLLAAAAVWPLAAQGPGFQLGRLFTDPPAVTYRAGTATRLFGPAVFGAHALFADSRHPIGNLFGVGGDLSLFRGGAAGAYLTGGLEGGFASDGRKTFWGSWSVGFGYELLPFSPLSIAAEGRYRELSFGGYDGIEIGLRLGLGGGRRATGRGRGAPPTATVGNRPAPVAGGGSPAAAPEAEVVRDDLSRAGVPADRATLISGVVQTALDVMGMPYKWGDEGEQGFDCSGLIQYAFGRHGIVLPRRSLDQAREGTEIPRVLHELQAGDILTFATRGRQVSHVGLYLGNGRFIHSATGGVQVSVLSPDDVSGRWWFRRWVGVRRIA